MNDAVIIVKYFEGLGVNEIAGDIYEILQENGCIPDRTKTFKERITGEAETYFIYETLPEDFPRVPHLEQLLSPIKQIRSISMEENV